MRVLFVGPIQPYLTTAARLDAMRELGLAVEALDQRPYVSPRGRWMRALTHWSLLTPGVFAFNRDLLSRAREARPALVWIEKGVFVFPRTLRALRRELPGAALVYHNTDDWKGRDRLHQLHWRYLLRGLELYDVHITSNLHNVREFREAGLPHVLHMELAANPTVRDPGPLSEAERSVLGAPVGFIGHWEPVTERLVLRLVRDGIGVKVYGQGWDDAEHRDELEGVVQYRWIDGDEYARAIVSFDINLGIVSKWNRNHTASRSFQIPALGAFLMHERNELMTRYFREGEEAEFFDSEDELLEKCRHYLAHPDERRRVAEAGRRRCRESGYFEIDRVREVLAELAKIVPTRSGP
jgi:spore maturation protein CgeB